MRKKKISQAEAVQSSDELMDKYKLRFNRDLDIILTVIAADSYGSASSDDDDAICGRYHGSETLTLLRRISALAQDVEGLDFVGFAGARDFAIADYVGTEALRKVSSALEVLARLTERDRPLLSNRRLAKITVRALVKYWCDNARDVGPANVSGFVQDALRGRRRFRKQLVGSLVRRYTVEFSL